MIVICGTARNIEGKLEDSIKDLYRAFSSFKQVKFLICESFSTDQTLLELDKLKIEVPNFDYFSDSEIDKNEWRRTVRIASARNELQKKIRDEYENYDYVAMVDLDGVNRDLNKKSVESIWQFDFWDAVFANQPLRYYDIWALRAKGWNEGDCWNEYQNLLKILPSKEAHRIAVTSKMKSISEKSQPIRVESAFGGLGIYRTSVFLESLYLGMDDEGNEICEHIHFHETLSKKGYQLFIMPSLVNLNRRSQILNILKERILRATKRIK
jgi:glycosyltransferase involved in cell wall biosynthesis